MPRAKKPDHTTKLAKFESKRKAHVLDIKEKLLSILHATVGQGLTLEQVKIHPENDMTTFEELPYSWKLLDGFTFPKQPISKWNKSHFASVEKAIAEGNIQAEYCLREFKGPNEEKRSKGKGEMKNRRSPDFKPRGRASESPEFDWKEDGPRIVKKVGRRMRKLEGEELSEWESGSTEEEEDLTELAEEFAGGD